MDPGGSLLAFLGVISGSSLGFLSRVDTGQQGLKGLRERAEVAHQERDSVGVDNTQGLDKRIFQICERLERLLGSARSTDDISGLDDERRDGVGSVGAFFSDANLVRHGHLGHEG